MPALPIGALSGIGLDPTGGLGATAATAPTAATQPGAGAVAPTGPDGTSFQGMLADKLNSVAGLQSHADVASRAVASGTSSDLASATVAVEKASIALELTSAVRNKAIDAYQEIMRMSV